MKNRLITCLIVIIGVIVLCGASVVVMFAVKFCPPSGPWPMPPWCAAKDGQTANPITLPNAEQIAELLATDTPVDEPYLVEDAVVIPTDISLVNYPQIFNTPELTASLVENPYCALEKNEVAYPAAYLGDHGFPPVNGAPLADDIQRVVGIKDVWIEEPNLNNCPFKTAYAPMREALEQTILRVVALGGDEITFSNYIHFVDFETAELQSPDQAAIKEDDLRYIAKMADVTGRDMTLYLNLAPGNVKVSWEIPGEEWLATLINNWEPFVVEQAKLAEEIGIDALMINHFDYQPSIKGFEAVYQAEMMELYAAVKSVYRGRILLLIEPVIGADLDQLDTLLSVVDGFIFTPKTDILQDREDQSVTVENLKQAYRVNISGIGTLFNRYDKGFLLRILIQSEKDFLVKGWNEDMFCIARGDDPCYQKSLPPDFSVQAIAYEAILEAISEISANGAMKVERVETYGYWFTDVILPAISQPQMAHSVRNKPAEAILFEWFKRGE